MSEWISVTERLPKEGDYWNILDKLTVIAWMEYQEPYKEEV